MNSTKVSNDLVEVLGDEGLLFLEVLVDLWIVSDQLGIRLNDLQL